MKIPWIGPIGGNAPHCENALAVIDTHLHILPGIDDGPQSVDESIALAAALIEQGVTAVAATPHVSARYPNTADRIETDTAALNLAIDRAGAVLSVTTAAEVAFDRLPLIAEDELVRLTYGGHGRHLLVETPYAAWPMDIEVHISRLLGIGITPVLAHPERCAAVQADLAPLMRLLPAGVLVQITAGSILGRGGDGAKRCAFALLAEGAVALLASDAHGPVRRAPQLEAAANALGSTALAQWITETAPAALVGGRVLPERPKDARAEPRGWSRGPSRRLFGGRGRH